MINKKLLLDTCKKEMEKKLNGLQVSIDSYKQDLNSETKSSAGDKHETGRAMMQLEMEKLGQQYSRLIVDKEVLDKIDTEFVSDRTRLGSIIETNFGIYFIANSLGVINIESKKVFVISTNSPIGKLLLGKQKNESFSFQGRNCTIRSVY